jgi:TolB-like protein
MLLVKIGVLWIDPDEVLMVTPVVNLAGDPQPKGCRVYFKRGRTDDFITINDETADSFIEQLKQAYRRATRPEPPPDTSWATTTDIRKDNG